MKWLGRLYRRAVLALVWPAIEERVCALAVHAADQVARAYRRVDTWYTWLHKAQGEAAEAKQVLEQCEDALVLSAPEDRAEALARLKTAKRRVEATDKRLAEVWSFVEGERDRTGTDVLQSWRDSSDQEWLAPRVEERR